MVKFDLVEEKWHVKKGSDCRFSLKKHNAALSVPAYHPRDKGPYRSRLRLFSLQNLVAWFHRVAMLSKYIWVCKWNKSTSALAHANALGNLFSHWHVAVIVQTSDILVTSCCQSMGKFRVHNEKLALHVYFEYLYWSIDVVRIHLWYRGWFILYLKIFIGLLVQQIVRFCLVSKKIPTVPITSNFLINAWSIKYS